MRLRALFRFCLRPYESSVVYESSPQFVSAPDKATDMIVLFLNYNAEADEIGGLD